MKYKLKTMVLLFFLLLCGSLLMKPARVQAALVNGNTIADGVWMGDIDLSGKTLDEAKALLEDYFKEVESSILKIYVYDNYINKDKPGETEGTMNKMYFKPDMTIYQIQEVLDQYIDTNRGAGKTNSTDKLMATLLSIPGLARVGVNLIRRMDWHGLLPKAVIDASPFHCTMTITNLASIGTNYIFHHVYNFGTTSMLMAMGNTREDPVKRHGEIVFDKVIPIGLVMDERIADGAQFALACKKLQSILQNPEVLEQPPEVVKEDIK